MERQSTRKCEQLEIHVILLVCCWRNFCLGCTSDSCLDVLEWKSAPNVPREKPQNCQKTLSFLSPRILNSKWKVPVHPLHKKHTSAITVLCSSMLQKTDKWLSPKSTKVRRCSVQLPGQTLSPSVTPQSLTPDTATSDNDQEPGEHPLRLTWCQSRAILLNSIFIPYFFHAVENNMVFAKYITTHMWAML